MITQVQFGNIFNSGGRQVLGGTNTGFDTEALVTGLADAKRLPAVQLEKKLEQNAAKQSALREFQSILSRFKDAANFLRNPPGVQNAGDNIFEYRTAKLTSNSGVAASNYLDVTVEPGATKSNYDIEVNQIATQNVQTTNTFAAANLNSIIVNPGHIMESGVASFGAAGTNVTFNDGDTLADVIGKINAVKGESGVEASAIKVADGQYRIQLKTLDTGAAANYTMTPGIFDNTGFAISLSALDAQMTIDGTTVSRSTNSIDDLVDGVTFTLKQATPPATTIDTDITADTEIARNGILNFVDTYNELRIFMSKQTEIGSNGLPTEEAVLASNSTLRNSLTTIMGELSRAVSGLSGNPSRLSDLGISFSDFPGDEETPYTRNILRLDQEKLDSALVSNFDAVRKVFEFDFTSDEAEVQVFNRTNSLNVSEFSLNIDVTNGVYEATYDSGGGVMKTVALDMKPVSGGGMLLTGKSGTALEGLQLIYSGTTDTVANINISQGVGDRIFNSLETMLKDGNGAVSIEISSLSDSSVRIEEEIARIDQMVERFREQMLAKFASLEQAISSINTILQSLDAQNQAAQNN